MSQGETDLERFRRVTGATVRAICEREDVTVAFTPNAQGLTGNEVRVQSPSRDLNPREVVQVRGSTDAAALRLRHHDSALHGRRRPIDPLARDVFDAVEQARYEAIGMRQMAGVAENLDWLLEQRCRDRGYAEVSSREEAPLSEVLRVLTREAMTGRMPPPSARSMVDLWRSAIDSRVQEDLRHLSDVCVDQEAYSEAVRQLLTHLELDPTSQEEAEGEEETEGQDDQSEPDGESQDGEGDESSAEMDRSQDSDQQDSSDGESSDADMMEAEGTSTVRLLEGGTHNVNIRHDENITRETSVVRSHPETVDVWVVQRGWGVLATGGELVNGEHVGGVERVIAAGDVIFIPAGTLHGIRETRSITWLNIRYDMVE